MDVVRRTNRFLGAVDVGGWWEERVWVYYTNGGVGLVETCCTEDEERGAKDRKRGLGRHSVADHKCTTNSLTKIQLPVRSMSPSCRSHTRNRTLSRFGSKPRRLLAGRPDINPSYFATTKDLVAKTNQPIS
jgi:hypothetical protein